MAALTDSRITEALDAWKPAGVTYRFKQRLVWSTKVICGLTAPFRPAHAQAHRDGTREIYCADPRMFARDADRRLALFLVAHECGHWSNGHCTRRSKLPRHLEEYEAEMRAQEMMRTRGLAVPQRGRAIAKLYVRICIKGDEARGIKIASHIRRWSAR